MKIHTFLIAFVLVFGSACAKEKVNDESVVKHLSAKEFKEVIEDGSGNLVDIRTLQEYNMGHIEGAQMIDFYSSGFRQDIDKLDHNEPVYIYCRSGNRTSQSVRILEELGFKEIVNLKQGLIDWQRSGYSLSTP